MNKEKKATQQKVETAQATPAKVQPAKQNATQKLEALENAFMAQNQQINILADEIDRLNRNITSLNKRINASLKAADEGGLNTDSVNKIIMNEEIKELESKITYLVEQGVLERSDEQSINDKTFVVGRHVDAEGNVVNPRIQFAVGSVDDSVKASILAKKAGDVISYEDGEPNLEITEVYKILDPKVKKVFEQPAQQ